MNAPPDAGEICPNCGAAMAPDQRYCLTCGNRRGDPRLPFMDAVVFMDAVKKSEQPPPPPAATKQDRRPLMSANASLVAGVATLVLAIGVGVLIGRSGEGSSTNAAATPQVIKVGGGTETEESTASTNKPKESKASKGNSKSKSSSGSKAAKEKTQEGSSGTSKAAEDVLEPTEGVKLPPPTTQLGEKCEEGAAGCEGGEFNGDFFE